MNSHSLPVTMLADDNQQKCLVLLVDDQLIIGEAVRRVLLNQPDIEFHFCSDCANAVEVAKRVRPTVILQDLVMPGISGLDLVAEYRAEPETSQTPIIVLSTKEEGAIKGEAFRLGANDYIVKLPESVELIARIRYHSNAYLAQIQRDLAYRALRRSQQELMEVNLELQRLTEVDGLTGLSNRRHMNEYLEAEWQHAAKMQASLSVLMIDIDHFKFYNDQYGHLAGDRVLQRVAQALKASCRRATDVAARYGGEEFAVVLPSTPSGDANAIAHSIVAEVEQLHIPHIASSTSPWVTVSIGGATITPVEGRHFALVIDAADKALYEAKRNGRNLAVMSARS